MRLLLDTSAIIDFVENGNPRVAGLISKAEEVYTSSICAYEALVGDKYIELKGRGSKVDFSEFFERISNLDFTYQDAKVASRITAELMLKGKKIDDFDVLIAAQALNMDAVLLTQNKKDFDTIKEYTGLKIEVF